MSPGPRNYALTPTQVRSWLDALIAADWEIIAPRSGRAGDGPHRFERIASATEATLDPGTGVRTRWSAKEFLLPRHETLLVYAQNNGSIQLDQPPLDTQPRVLFGLTPCDAAGLERLTAVFHTGPGDPYVEARRNATAVVTLTCAAAAPECFCTSVGDSPGSEQGSDVQLTAVDTDGDRTYLLRPLTGKGERLIEASREPWAPCSAEMEDRALEQLEQVEASITRDPIPDDASTILERAFAEPTWEEVAEPCLGCKVCTSVCPSCSCFAIYDEGTTVCGQRCRCWDGCTQQLFTAHATGHNPRPTQAARLRQRVMHKFSYFPSAHDGLSMCVGCGRCALACPAGLDVHQTVMRVIERMRAQAPEGASRDA